MEEEASSGSPKSLGRLRLQTLVYSFRARTECASGEWGHGRGGCSWRVRAWRPASAASSPRSPLLSDPECNRASSCPRRARRSSPGAAAKRCLQFHGGAINVDVQSRRSSTSSGAAGPHWRGILDTTENLTFHLVKSSAVMLSIRFIYVLVNHLQTDALSPSHPE